MTIAIIATIGLAGLLLVMGRALIAQTRELQGRDVELRAVRAQLDGALDKLAGIRAVRSEAGKQAAVTRRLRRDAPVVTSTNEAEA